MRPLVASQANRWIELQGGKTYAVPAPTTRQALAVLAYYQQQERGEVPDLDTRFLRRTCAEWLPLPPFSVLFADGYPAGRRRRMLMNLVWAGLPPNVRERFEAAEGEGEDRAAGSGYWSRQIARYCSRYGASWQEAMAVPFPAMLGQLVHLDMVQAQAVKDVADANIIVRSEEGEDAYERMADQAAGGTARTSSVEETPDSDAYSDDPETRKKWLARKKAEMYKAKKASKGRSQKSVKDT